MVGERFGSADKKDGDTKCEREQMSQQRVKIATHVHTVHKL